MGLRRLISEAFQTLRSNKGRSFLTLIGIVIGISSVITIISVGLGVQAYIDMETSSLGANVVMIRAGNFVGSEDGYSLISRGDLNEICGLPYVIDCTPVVEAIKVAGGAGDRSVNLILYGYSESGIDLAGNELVHGRGYTKEEILDASPVIVTWQPVAERLFPGVSNGAIGEKILIDNVSYEIIGEYAERGFGQAVTAQFSFASVPYTAMQLRHLDADRNHYAEMMAFVDLSAKPIGEAMDEIEALLRRRHQITGSERSDFMITTSTEMLGMIETVTKTFVIFLSGVAGISLLVAGIGIMNIMLVTVTERTREIGLRKAVGGTNFDILTQFLFEAAVLSMVGGLIGIALGLGASFCLEAVFRSLGNGFEMIRAQVDVGMVGLTVLFAGTFGVVFGFAPARRAAKMEPVLALRSE